MLRNIQGPKRNLILARLEGGRWPRPASRQGMSGSPVYIDGRLIGAVSYSIGAFSKEPIAGITPIAEMKDATGCRRASGARSRRASSCRSRRESLTAALSAAYAPARAVRQRPADVQSIGLPGVPPARSSARCCGRSPRR